MTEEIKIDEVDEKIIQHFQRDGRMSNRAVGEIVGLSEGAVRKRLKRLTEIGAVTYGVVIDIQATEMGVSGSLAVEVDAGHLMAVGKSISELEQCALCVVTTGSTNLRAYIYDKDRPSLARSTAKMAALEGVLRVEFREAVYFTQHRYELIMMPDEHHGSAWTL